MQRCPTVSASEPRQLSFSNGSLRHVKILQADQPQLLNPGLDGQHAAEMLELEEPELDPGDLQQIGPPFKAVQQIEVSLHNLPDPGNGDKVRPLTPKRRLHRKTRPTFPSAAVAPTLRRSLGGESVLEELQVIDQWMLFQNKMLSRASWFMSCWSMWNMAPKKPCNRSRKKQIACLDENEATQQELEEVLQTRTVSIQEVRQDMSAWAQPFREEYETLCRTVIGPMTPEMTKEVTAKARYVERIPNKIVPTSKPPHKKRGRIVACGNYASTPDGEVSAGGVETICLTTLMRKSGHMGWTISTIDIKKALLNPLRVEKDGHVTIIEPPSVLVAMGAIPSSESWRVRGAIYGLVQSPRDLGS